jgi:hypoxanthine phosphoribosyltransferase
MDKYRFTYQDIHVAIGSGGFIPARMLRTFINKPILA